MASADLRDELLCSICLNVYRDPAILRCGHNFCRGCIDQVLKTQERSGVYSCPECRAKFWQRPALIRNITLHNIAERFLTSQRHLVEITGTSCTYCLDSAVPAVKSCLHCEASLCDKHLKVHSKSPEHVLTDPITSLEKRQCSVHKKILEYYCTEDASCVCADCRVVGEHRGHQVEMLDDASEKKRKKLRNVLNKLITKRAKTEERVQSLEESRRKAQEKASREAERVTALFIDIRRRVDDLEKRVLSEISRREEQVLDVIQRLKIEKDELSRKMRHIEELCNMTDPLTVLQDPDTGDLCDPEEGGGDEVTEGHDGGDQSLEMMSHTLSDIIRGVNLTFYSQDPADILLDVNTNSIDVLISDDLKTASSTIDQNLPETAERFQDMRVMSSQKFTSGRHYWDVDTSETEWMWRVGMCYPSIDRSGEEHSPIGENNKSWGLDADLEYSLFSVFHDNKKIQLPHQISSYRFRIYLDYEGGQLSFYELCDPIRHLHTFTATFTEPLHAVVYFYDGSIKISG